MSDTAKRLSFDVDQKPDSHDADSAAESCSSTSAGTPSTESDHFADMDDAVADSGATAPSGDTAETKSDSRSSDSEADSFPSTSAETPSTGSADLDPAIVDVGAGSCDGTASLSEEAKAAAAISVKPDAYAQAWNELHGIAQVDGTPQEKRVAARELFKGLDAQVDVKSFYEAVLEASVQTDNPLAFLHETRWTRFHVQVGQQEIPTSRTFYDFACTAGHSAEHDHVTSSPCTAEGKGRLLEACAQQFNIAGVFSPMKAGKPLSPVPRHTAIPAMDA